MAILSPVVHDEVDPVLEEPDVGEPVEGKLEVSATQYSAKGDDPVRLPELH